MKKTLIFATKVEAAPFINGLKMQKTDDKFFSIYNSNELYLIISGVGKTAAALAAAYAILTLKAEMLYNFGAAGSVNAKYKESDVVHIDSVIETDRPLFNNHKPGRIKPDILDNFKTAVLATQDHAVLSNEERKEISEFADLVDMEGAGFISACRKFKKRGYIFKIISDSFDNNCAKAIVERIKELSDSLYEYIAVKKILTFM